MEEEGRERGREREPEREIWTLLITKENRELDVYTDRKVRKSTDEKMWKRREVRDKNKGKLQDRSRECNWEVGAMATTEERVSGRTLSIPSWQKEYYCETRERDTMDNQLKKQMETTVSKYDFTENLSGLKSIEE